MGDNFTGDPTDNYAYALVLDDSVEFTFDGQTKRYFWLDIIEGTDWDNNGRIDLIEHLYGELDLFFVRH